MKYDLFDFIMIAVVGCFAAVVIVLSFALTIGIIVSMVQAMP